jgi:hypothetical protein
MLLQTMMLSFELLPCIAHQRPIVRAIWEQQAWNSTSRAHVIDCSRVSVACTDVVSDNLKTKANIMIKQQVGYQVLL